MLAKNTFSYPMKQQSLFIKLIIYNDDYTLAFSVGNRGYSCQQFVFSILRFN